MKRIILLFLGLLLVSVQYVYGDEIKNIKLDNNGHNSEVVSLPDCCNLYVELQQEDRNDQYAITVKMENISEDKILCLFDRSYREKDLKKIGLIYDKLFPGAKGKRNTEECSSLSKPYRLLPSSDKESIINIQGNDSSVKCRIPIYIARYDVKNLIIVKKTRIALAQKFVIELDIDIQLKPDEDYIRLSAAADSLIEDIGRQTFCSNENHQGNSLNTLYSIFNKSIDDLKGQVQHIISTRNYMSSDKGYKNFNSIYEKLNNIDLEKLTVTSCDKDKQIRQKAVHRCKFCSLSAEEIYKQLESYYIDIHNGKKTKKQIKAAVDALYNCALKNYKRSTGSYMPRISMYYNRLKEK